MIPDELHCNGHLLNRDARKLDVAVIWALFLINPTHFSTIMVFDTIRIIVSIQSIQLTGEITGIYH